MEATVVSLFPGPIKETKPGLIPDTFEIEESDGRIPKVLVVPDIHSALYIGDGKTFRLTHTAYEIAESIVNDFCNGFIQADAENKPGIFWLKGKHTAENIKTQFPKEFEEAVRKQKSWLMRLVMSADDDFQKHGQRRGISDLQRRAAYILGLTNRPWYVAPEPTTYIKCPACATMVDESAAICQNCHFTVNVTRAKELGLVKA